MTPLVSIVIPCYKGAAYLSQAIESCLAQTHKNLELLVVDDASPDNCAEIASGFAERDSRVKLIRRPVNGGVAAALNSGYAQASGDYFTRLAQDDLFRPNALEVMLREYKNHPDAGLIYCDEQVIDEAGGLREIVQRPPPDKALENGNKIGLAVMWPRKVWERIGGFDSNYDTVEDYEFWLRLVQHFPIYHCSEPALLFRIHSNMGSKVFSVKQELLMTELAARNARGFKRRRILAQGHFNAGYNAGQQGNKQEAIRLLKRSICLWPFSIKPFKRLGYSLLMKDRNNSKA